MYATSSFGGVYHLLAPELRQTMCGLEVVPIIIDRPTKASCLYLTSREPSDRKCCRECARISSETRAAKDSAGKGRDD